jgi:hypothetical protein
LPVLCTRLLLADRSRQHWPAQTSAFVALGSSGTARSRDPLIAAAVTRSEAPPGDESDHAATSLARKPAVSRPDERIHATAIITGGWREVDPAYARIGLTRLRESAENS